MTATGPPPGRNSACRGGIDYDEDNDNLIEIADLAQLNAIRRDPDGNGLPAGDGGGYASAFTNAAAAMGCQATCAGYELTADLDFDTNNDGRTDVAGGDYWNDGAGWNRIGVGGGSNYDTEFHGNGHTISNLFINDGSDWVGLFTQLNNNAYIHHVGLLNVNVTGGRIVGTLTGGSSDGVNGSRIAAVYVNGGTVTGNSLEVGGLIGKSRGTVAASWTRVDVRSATAAESYVGGLTGRVFGKTGSPSMRASYAAGSVAIHPDSATNFVGGAVGIGYAPDTDALYYNSNIVPSGTFSAQMGRTAAELRAPTDYSGIYANWNVDLDGDGMADAPWDFGTNSEYPKLKADRDGDGIPTWQEFGTQTWAPGATDPPTLGMPTANSIEVTWRAPADTGSSTPTYQLRYRFPSASEWTTQQTDCTATLTALEQNRVYEVQVRATNPAPAGDGPWSTSSIGPTTVDQAVFSAVLTVGTQEIGNATSRGYSISYGSMIPNRVQRRS